MRRVLDFLCLSFVLAVAAPAAPARADWPQTGYPLCNVPEDLGVPIGLSNTFCFFGCARSLALFWQDGRSNFGSIYTAEVNDAQPPDPPPVSEATLYLQRPGTQTPGGMVLVDLVQCLSQFCSAANVFVWTDAPDTIPPLIRARREGDQEPSANWGPDGVIVAASEGAQSAPSVIHDEHGGAIIAWLEETPAHRLAFAQRLDPFGQRLWGASGLVVGTDTTTQTRPQIARDGVGGAYVLRGDTRGGTATLALFRLRPDGAIAPGWPASGVVLGTLPHMSPEPLLRATSSGAWVVWSEDVPLSDASPASRPFVTLVDSSGVASPVFTAAGTPIATGLDGDAVADDAAVGGGDDVTIAYEYTQRLPGPSSSSTDLFAARFEVEGSHPIGWPESGLVISGAPGVQRQGRIVGSFFAWTDERSGDGDIYALLVRSDGTSGAEWPADGLLVCGVAGTQQDPVVGANAVGGAFVAWRDGRDALTNGWDLYAQTVSGDARLDVEHPIARAFALSPARPNPARGAARFRLELPEARDVRFEVLDVAGRLVHREDIRAEAGARELTWDGRTSSGGRARPGLYLIRVRAGTAQRSTRVVLER